MLAYYSKWFFVIVSYFTGISIALNLVPNYHQFSNKDSGLWVMAFILLSLAQSLLLSKVGKCCICRLWSDCLLQVNGVLFILLAAAFTAEYPPLSWAMIVFPILGVVCLVLGRIFSIKSRLRLRGYKQNGTFSLLD